MDNRAWVSTDLMISSIVIMAVIISIITVSKERIEAAHTIDQMSNARLIAKTIAESIEIVYSGGENHYMILKTPPSVVNRPYSIIIYSSGVYIKYDKMLGSAFIPQNVISDTYSSNIILLPNKTYNISNIKDENGNTEVIIRNT